MSRPVDPSPRRNKRPGRLWLLFYGRQRRGFPGLLVGLTLTVVALALLFAIPGGADVSRYAELAAIAIIVLLLIASVAAVVVAALRPRRRR